MSSTLCIRRTPKREASTFDFKLPIKGMVARRFFGHDGSLGGSTVTAGPDDLDWFEGILAAGQFDARDRRDLEKVVQILRDGDTIDMWFEV